MAAGRRRALALLGLALTLSGCAQTKPAGLVAAPATLGTRFVGVASWYGQAHHGRRTASGETFDMHRLTAAHRTLPFGTRLRVTNVDNGRSVVVRVNDRGPHVAGRILDVSHAGAKALGMTGTGVTRVEIVVLAHGE